MKRAAFVLIMLAPAMAQNRQERGKQIVDQALAALGGDRFRQVKDRIEMGRVFSFYREQLTGLSRARIYTRYLVRPEPPKPGFFGQRERQAFGKDKEEDSAVLFTEADAWQISFRGARPMPDDVVTRYRDSTMRNILYILRQRLGEPGLIFEFQSREIFENLPVEVVDITDSDNRVVSVSFHHLTHLPLRQVYYRRDPQTKERMEEITLYTKYRDVGGGVQWPFNIVRFRNGEKIYEIFSESVTINQNLTDHLFTLPANLKILKK
jgi:hypothetical protein